MRWLIIFFLVVFGWGDIKDILLIESKLYPKIVKLNSKKNSIKIAVLYRKDKYLAQELKRLLEKEGVEAVVSNKVIDGVDAYIVFDKIKGLIKKRKLIFGVFPYMVESVMITIDINVRVRPYINLYMVKKAGIKLNPVILKVSKIYE